MLGVKSEAVQTQRLPKTRLLARDITQVSLAVSWLRVRGAEQYDVAISPMHEVTRIEREDVAAASFKGLVPATTYTIRVRARAGESLSPWAVMTAETLDFELQALAKDDSPILPVYPMPCSECTLQICPQCKFYGSLDDATPTGYRFATFEAGELHARVSARLRLTGAMGTWESTGWGKLADTHLHVRIDQGPWLDANALHVPSVNTTHANGWPCALKVKKEVRRITFGGQCVSGVVYARIGLPCDGRRLSGIRCD